MAGAPGWAGARNWGLVCRPLQHWLLAAAQRRQQLPVWLQRLPEQSGLCASLMAPTNRNAATACRAPHYQPASQAALPVHSTQLPRVPSVPSCRVLEACTGVVHPRSQPLDTSRIASIRMGTTVRFDHALAPMLCPPCLSRLPWLYFGCTCCLFCWEWRKRTGGRGPWGLAEGLQQSSLPLLLVVAYFFHPCLLHSFASTTRAHASTTSAHALHTSVIAHLGHPTPQAAQPHPSTCPPTDPICCRWPQMHCWSGRGSAQRCWSLLASGICCTLGTRAGQISLTCASARQRCGRPRKRVAWTWRRHMQPQAYVGMVKMHLHLVECVIGQGPTARGMPAKGRSRAL